MSLEGILKYPLSFLTAFAIAYALTPLCISLAKITGIVDHPGLRRVHDRPVPRAGGVAIFAAIHLTIACFYFYPKSELFFGAIHMAKWIGLLAASSVLLVVGLIDDKFNLNWFIKLSAQIVATVIVFTYGLQFRSIQEIDLPNWLNFLATAVWFLAFINAFNLIDGLDGLASGLGAISAIGLAASAIYSNLPFDALTLLAVTGACLGFLRYNFNPARIFLGDSGSMVLGFFLAAIGLSTSSKGSTVAAIGVPFLAVGVPFFDTILAIWRRSVKAMTNRDKFVGQVVSADMEHLHHRLLKSGLTQRKAALVLYALNALLVAFAVLTVVFNSRSTGIFLLASLLGTYIIVKHLAQIELWDTGNAILSGLRRPKKAVIPFLFYPLIDAGLLCLSLGIALFLIFEPSKLSKLKELFTAMTPLWCAVPFIALGISGIYSKVWSRARPSDFGFLGLTLIISFFLCVALRLIAEPENVIRTILLGVSHGGMSSVLIVGIRTLPRLIQDLMVQTSDPRTASEQNGILIYGAGMRGLLYLRKRSFSASKGKVQQKVLGFLDDESGLRKRNIHGYTVFGGWEELSKTVDKLKPYGIIIACDFEPDRLAKLTEYCMKKSINLIEWSIVQRNLTDNFQINGLSSKDTEVA